MEIIEREREREAYMSWSTIESPGRLCLALEFTNYLHCFACERRLRPNPAFASPHVRTQRERERERERERFTKTTNMV